MFEQEVTYQDQRVNEVVESLKEQLTTIEQDIKRFGFLGALLVQVTKRKNLIQQKLDEIAAKKGILTNEELYDAQVLAASIKTEQLKAENKKTVRNAILIVSGFVVVISGIWYFTIKKK